MPRTWHISTLNPCQIIRLGILLNDLLMKRRHPSIDIEAHNPMQIVPTLGVFAVAVYHGGEGFLAVEEKKLIKMSS